MTRANPQGPILDFYPEIERTQRHLKRRIRNLMERNNNGQPPADGQGLPAQADGAIAPPIPQNNQQPPVRIVRDYLAEDLEGLNPAVTMPEFEAEHFELKPVMFNMLNTLGQFGGSPTENAQQHLKSFLEICNSFKIHGVSNDVLKLKLFPYSLRDKAKAWLNNLQPGSLQSWTQLCRSFLTKFSYTNMTDHLRNQITSFRQEDDEAMHEAWERYRDLFRRCLMHGLLEWTQVSIFYNSVNTPTTMMLDVSANGTLLDKPPRESLEILDKLVQNDYQQPTSRRGTISDTEVAKGATHEQCKAITTRSEKILVKTSNKRGTAVSSSAAIDTHAEADEPTQTSEDHCDPLNTTKGESSAESSHARSDKPEEIRPPPPFPQRLKK
ncbi:hypothetical protein V6N11_036554 [Hibiscus sabdariffa]|uniref:Retrotransposon gag domain-containing protein n=1 Tax=Hibiscus sabdariffa TaxID=183260 RepID=A0ABR2RAR8_9ROSI